MKKFLIVGLFCGAFLAVWFAGESPVAKSGRGQGGGVVIVSGNGDVNGDNGLDLSDAIYLLGHLFQGGPPPEPCPLVAETACSDGLDDDEDGDTDCDDSDCYQGANCPGNEDCGDNVDNDGDGATDCDDWDCSNSDLGCTPLPLPGFTYAGTKNAQGYHEWTHDRTGIIMVQLPGGLFNMGAQKQSPGGPNYDPIAGWGGVGPIPPAGFHSEVPVHGVILSPFLIGKYEVTNKQYSDLTGGDPPESLIAFEDDRPVDSARFDGLHDIRGNFLEQSLLLLPTEAQWEYACRAGTSTVYSSGDGDGPTALKTDSALETVGWYSENSDTGSGREPHVVGTKDANQFGIHDMHGNVLEYVEDYWFSDFYNDATAPTPPHPATDPLATRAGGPSGSTVACVGNDPCAVQRGGIWDRNRSDPQVSSKALARSAFRSVNSAAAGATSGINGFRLSLPLPTGPGPEFDCTDGVDDDGDGDTDCADFDCAADAGCPLEETSCNDGQDNDGDGLVDCDDCDCNCTPNPIAGFTVEPCNAQGYREWIHTQTGMRMVMLAAGTARIGGQSADPWDWNYDPFSQRFLVDVGDVVSFDTRNEELHEVTLSPYLIGIYEVTQGEYKGVTSSNPSLFRNDSTEMPPKTDCFQGAGNNACDDRPVENVTWGNLYTEPTGVRKPAGFLGLTDLHFPTEAQWEYACRAGQPSGRYSGNGKLDDMGWHSGNSFTGTPTETSFNPEGTETHDVGGKMPNQFGIYDMHGNVFEWVRDSYAHGDFYASTDGATDPLHEGIPACAGVTCTVCSGAAFCSIFRGGYFGTDPSANPSRPTCRSAARGANSPNAKAETLGFRAAFYPIPGR